MSNNEKKRENGQGNAEGLPKIETQEALVKKIQGNPGLRLDQIISGDDFASLFPNVNYLKRFQARFSEHLKLVIQYIFANDIHFSRIFARHIHLSIFTEGLFSLYIDQLIERLLTNEADFARLFTNHTQFREFTKAVYAERTRVLSTFPLPKPEAKGPEGREVKRQSRADIPPDRDHFSGVFSSAKVAGVHAMLADFLDDASLSSLSQVTHSAQSVNREKVYEKRIKKEIGPDTKVLKNPTETFEAAYGRHRGLIDSLPPVNTPQKLVAWIETYPNYYFNQIVSDADFFHLFYDMNFIEAFQASSPRHINTIVERLLTSDVLFPQVLCHVNSFIRFKAAFPGSLLNRAIECMLADSVQVASVLNHINLLMTFQTEFPAYADRAAECVLADNVLFRRVFFSSPGVNPRLCLEMFNWHFPMYADRAEALFRTKQQQTKNVALPAGRSINQVVSSTSTPSYSPSMFASSSSTTTGSSQSQPAVQEAKEGLGRSSSFASIPAADLPDNDKDEDPDRSLPDSPRGSS